MSRLLRSLLTLLRYSAMSRSTSSRSSHAASNSLSVPARGSITPSLTCLLLKSTVEVKYESGVAMSGKRPSASSSFMIDLRRDEVGAPHSFRLLPKSLLSACMPLTSAWSRSTFFLSYLGVSYMRARESGCNDMSTSPNVLVWRRAEPSECIWFRSFSRSPCFLSAACTAVAASLRSLASSPTASNRALISDTLTSGAQTHPWSNRFPKGEEVWFSSCHSEPCGVPSCALASTSRFVSAAPSSTIRAPTSDTPAPLPPTPIDGGKYVCPVLMK
mmetsp:Transcript_86337/g.243782  ORF Transcript_86337/g.243782 Transcript_86337/m.243782 type:complete len:273 (+) Transcript_86337:582-1400(+)